MVTATSNPWPITPITSKDLDFAVVNYDFTTFVDNEQSELPSLEGAIDLTLLDYAASVADQTVLIASLFDGLDDLGLIPGEIDSSDDVGSTLGELANSAAAGDAALGDYTGQIGGSTGGGGGTGGGTSGQCAVIDFGAQQVVSQGSDANYEKDWTVQNNTSSPIHVKGATFSGSSRIQWTLVHFPGGETLQPGEALTLTIIFTPQFPGHYEETLTLLTDAPDPQPCAQLRGTGVGSARLG